MHLTQVASDKVYQLLAHGRWFSLGTPASSTTKTGRHDIAETLLKVALKTKNLNQINSLREKSSIPIFCQCGDPWKLVLCWYFISIISYFLGYNSVYGTNYKSKSQSSETHVIIQKFVVSNDLENHYLGSPKFFLDHKKYFLNSALCTSAGNEQKYSDISNFPYIFHIKLPFFQKLSWYQVMNDFEGRGVIDKIVVQHGIFTWNKKSGL